jgi:hypothetical protein
MSWNFIMNNIFVSAISRYSKFIYNAICCLVLNNNFWMLYIISLELSFYPPPENTTGQFGSFRSVLYNFLESSNGIWNMETKKEHQMYHIKHSKCNYFALLQEHGFTAPLLFIAIFKQFICIQERIKNAMSHMSECKQWNSRVFT